MVAEGWISAATGFVSASVLESATGLSVIGALPKLRRGTEESSPPDIRFFHRETINHIRATLQFGGPQYRAGVVLVTSSVPREGKSHLAGSLAASIAARGGRALLIHCPRPADTIDDLPADVGAPVRRGDRQTDNQLTVTETSPGLHIGRLRSLGSGAQALPSLRRARDELLALRDHYDMIVLDGPSVCANVAVLVTAPRTNE